MRFWDASALTPLLVEESSTPTLRDLFKNDEAVIVWWASPVECASGLARRLRERTLTEEQHQQALKALVVTLAGWRIVAPSDYVRYHAMLFVRRYPIRTGDALQLAAATVWADHRPGGLHFVCMDQQLSDAALAEGFTVLPA